MAVSRGVYLVPGGTWSGGVPGPGGVPCPGGVSGPGGCTWSRGVYLVLGGCTWSRGVYLVGCTWSGGGVPGQVLPPCGQTHACKNITFATSLRTVITLSLCKVDNVHQITLELKVEWNSGWDKRTSETYVSWILYWIILFFKRISCFGIGQNASSKRLLELVIS